MKRKVGELNNIPIVEGDPNLLKSNEILHKGGGQLSKRNKEGSIEDLASGSSSNSNGLRCYKRILKRQHTDITDIFNSVMSGIGMFNFIATSWISYVAADPNETDIVPTILPISQFTGDDRLIAYIIFDTSLANNSFFYSLGDSYPGDEAIDEVFNRTVNKSVEEILDYIAELGEPKALLLKEEFLKEYTQIDNLDEEYKEIVKNYLKNNIE